MLGLLLLDSALVLLGLWMWARGVPLRLPGEGRGAGIVAGLLFAIEFMFLFSALDLTTVARASIVFYSMPVWLALAAHVLLPGERLTALRSVGLVLAMAGVVIALADRGSGPGEYLGLGRILAASYDVAMAEAGELA